MKIEICGQNKRVKLATGEVVRVVRLNNAATTPPFVSTMKKVEEFMSAYGAVHRGAGPFASKTIEEYEAAIATIKEFIGASTEHELIFMSNTTDGINLLARMLNYTPENVILTSGIEHTSNNLPWQFTSNARIATFKTNVDGSFNLVDLYEKLEKLKPTLLAITGAHNLTGYIPPLNEICEKAHKYGTKIFVDAAQLAPHRPLELEKNGIDYVAFSAHKIYAPFGLGVLAVNQNLLNGIPVEPGGGTIDMLSEDGIIWANGVNRHQSGTHNVCGVIALAESCRKIQRLGWTKIIQHERSLTKLMVEELNGVPNVKTYVEPSVYKENHTGAFPFNIRGLHHALVSSILENEYGIETRSGTICNHRLVRKWMKVNDSEQRRIESEIRKGNLLASYGIVRASIGIHNTKEDVTRLIEAVKQIAKKGSQLSYTPVASEETYKVIHP